MEKKLDLLKHEHIPVLWRYVALDQYYFTGFKVVQQQELCWYVFGVLVMLFIFHRCILSDSGNLSDGLCFQILGSVLVVRISVQHTYVF